jgi:hypothetical protein
MSMFRSMARAVAVVPLVLLAGPASSAEMIECDLVYSASGWSAIYKTQKGTGQIKCSNGQTADVKIVAHGGGVTFGTSKVIDGKGTFSEVADISELYGTYAEADAHAGAGGAVDARVMMKQNVNLTLAGSGQGINVGFAFGSFRIEPL